MENSRSRTSRWEAKESFDHVSLHVVKFFKLGVGQFMNCKHVPDGRDGVLCIDIEFKFISDHTRQNVSDYVFKFRCYYCIDVT